jgi:tRNA A-37 threonylcarbamoyl transferase component Bud32
MSESVTLHDGREVVRIHPTKEIYELRSDRTRLVKILDGPMTSAIQNEIDLQIEAAMLGVAPKLYNYHVYKTVDTGSKVYIEMERLEGIALADMYGEASEDIADNIWEQMHGIVRLLYMNDIHYIDLTAYNFIVDNTGAVKVIDFGHAEKIHVNDFLKDFLQGRKGWNPDFR